MMHENKTVRIFDSSMAFSFYALVFFLPISIALVEIFSALALLSYILKRGTIFVLKVKERRQQKQPVQAGRLFLSSYKPIENPINKPLAVWIFVCALSIPFSQHPNLSLMAFLGKSLQNAFILFNFVEAIRNRKRLKIFLSAYFFSAFWVCLSGISQRYLGVEFMRQNVMEQMRVNSCLRAPNDFAVYLIFLIPIFLSLLFLIKSNRDKASIDPLFQVVVSKAGRAVLAVLALLALFCLGLTFSRGGWLALGLCIFLLFLNNWKMLLAMLSAGAVFVFVFVFKLIEERKFVGRHNLFGFSGRGAYWQEAINMFKDYPIFGVGLNAYSMVGRDYKITWGGYPHNCYLQMLAEQGVIGILAFLWLMITLYKGAIGSFKTITDPFLKALLWGVLTGFSGFLFQSFFDTFFFSVQLGTLMWLIMGLIVAIPNIAKESSV